MQRFSFNVSRTGVIFVVALFISTFSLAQQVENGVLDARLFDFSSKRLPVKGSWMWYDNQLLSPSEIKTAIGAYIQFPKIWNETRANQSSLGYATYTVNVLLPDSLLHIGLDMPDTYTSYRLWINGKIMAENGTVGKTKDATKPMWFAQSIYFERPGDTLKLVLQVANFYHAKGGVSKNLYLGKATTVLDQRELSKFSAFIECAALLIMFILFSILFFSKDRKKIIIYFSLLCLSWGIRSVFSNDYLFLQYFPSFNWVTSVKIEYMTLYIPMICAILFLSRLFINEGNQIIKYLFVTVNSIFIVFTLFASTLQFTRWVNVYLTFVGLLLLYGVIIVIRALINERIGSTFLTITVLLIVLLFAYDVFTYEGLFTYNPLVLSVGYIIIFLLMALALLLYLNIIKSKPKPTTLLTYADLYKDDTYKVK